MATIFKNVVGIGVFALSSGVAGGVSLVQAALMMLALAALSAWSFYLLGRAALDTNSADNDELWQRLVGPDPSVVQLGVLLMAFGSCVQYTISLVELLPSMGALFGLSAAALTGATRTAAIVALSSCLFPFCAAKDLKALRHVSSLGFGAVIYSAAFVLTRAFDGSYAPGGRFHAAGVGAAAAMAGASSAPPLFGFGLTATMASLAGTLNAAFMGHLNVPRYAVELRDATPRRFGRVVAASFGLVALLSMAVALAGVHTFGTGCHGLLLLNYDLVRDTGAQLTCAATFLSVLTGYPLIFFAMRDAVEAWVHRRFTAADVDADRDGVRQGPRRAQLLSVLRGKKALSFVLLVFCMIGSLIAKDVAFIISLRGALLGSLVNFAFPAFVFLRSARGRDAGRWTRRIHLAMIAYGFAGAAASTAACLLTQ